MNKNIAILGITVLAIMGSIYFTLAIVYDKDRFNPRKIYEAETQACSVDADCAAVDLSCDVSCEVAVATSNKDRYLELREKHCELNPPDTFIDISCGIYFPRCVGGSCQMVKSKYEDLITSKGSRR